MKKFVLASVVLIGTTLPVPTLAEENLSAVQLAAAARLATRLGELRGSVAPEDEFVFLNLEVDQPKWRKNTSPEITGSIPNRPMRTEKPALPPIVLEMGPKLDRLIDRIINGDAIKNAKTKPLEIAPMVPELPLIQAKAEYRPILEKELAEIRQVAGKAMAGFIPAPITKVRIYAGIYNVSIPVAR